MGSRTRNCLIALAILAAGPVTAQGCRDDVLRLKGDWGSARFNVDVADTVAERSKGLMFVEDMPSSQGMLFAYDQERPVSFWMKNTLIPLDIIFADAQGQVVSVHADAIPHDETPIPSGEPAQYVLEINGGLAERMGIVPGSVMQHPAIKDAVWACE
ncbi:hypothetical protein GCM10011415_00120 [Salipiger pallidus]|uniref:DUF192 domain-containing protein n=1 Tax=Salipiger pallidus TaxID=1775170 RepID=A0A8J2ZFT5_9RHOB|nr:DUF192 domain-containing protein [Salipiger pallidus]GGG58335.1 hypothetical protein GCM10011415_00120 [Salipiger pallidus]